MDQNELRQKLEELSGTAGEILELLKDFISRTEYK